MANSKFELIVNLLGEETKNLLAAGQYVLNAGLPHASDRGFHKGHGNLIRGSLPVTEDSPTLLKLEFEASPTGHEIACRTTLNGPLVPNSRRTINPGDCYTVTTTDAGIEVNVTPHATNTGWIDADSEFGIDNDVLIYPVICPTSLHTNGDLEEIELANTSNFTTLGPFVPGTGLITLPRAANSFVTWFEFAKKLELADGQTISLKDMTTEFLVSSWRKDDDKYVAEVNYNPNTVKTEAFELVTRRAGGKSDVPVTQPEGPTTQPEGTTTQPEESDVPNDHEISRVMAHLKKKELNQNGV